MAAAKKANKKSAPKKAAAGGAKRRRGKRSFKSYIAKVNKNSKRNMTLSSKAVKILNSMCTDMLDKLATQAAALARHNKKTTKKNVLKHTFSRSLIETLLMIGGVEMNPGPDPTIKELKKHARQESKKFNENEQRYRVQDARRERERERKFGMSKSAPNTMCNSWFNGKTCQGTCPFAHSQACYHCGDQCASAQELMDHLEFKHGIQARRLTRSPEIKAKINSWKQEITRDRQFSPRGGGKDYHHTFRGGNLHINYATSRDGGGNNNNNSNNFRNIRQNVAPSYSRDGGRNNNNNYNNNLNNLRQNVAPSYSRDGGRNNNNNNNNFRYIKTNSAPSSSHGGGNNNNKNRNPRLDFRSSSPPSDGRSSNSNNRFKLLSPSRNGGGKNNNNNNSNNTHNWQPSSSHSKGGNKNSSYNNIQKNFIHSSSSNQNGGRNSNNNKSKSFSREKTSKWMQVQQEEAQKRICDCVRGEGNKSCKNQQRGLQHFVVCFSCKEKCESYSALHEHKAAKHSGGGIANNSNNNNNRNNKKQEERGKSNSSNINRSFSLQKDASPTNTYHRKNTSRPDASVEFGGETWKKRKEEERQKNICRCVVGERCTRRNDQQHHLNCYCCNKIYKNRTELRKHVSALKRRRRAKEIKKNTKNNIQEEETKNKKKPIFSFPSLSEIIPGSERASLVSQPFLQKEEKKILLKPPSLSSTRPTLFTMKPEICLDFSRHGCDGSKGCKKGLHVLALQLKTGGTAIFENKTSVTEFHQKVQGHHLQERLFKGEKQRIDEVILNFIEKIMEDLHSQLPPNDFQRNSNAPAAPSAPNVPGSKSATGRVGWVVVPSAQAFNCKSCRIIFNSRTDWMNHMSLFHEQEEKADEEVQEDEASSSPSRPSNKRKSTSATPSATSAAAAAAGGNFGTIGGDEEEESRPGSRGDYERGFLGDLAYGRHKVEKETKEKSPALNMLVEIKGKNSALGTLAEMDQETEEAANVEEDAEARTSESPEPQNPTFTKIKVTESRAKSINLDAVHGNYISIATYNDLAKNLKLKNVVIIPHEADLWERASGSSNTRWNDKDFELASTKKDKENDSSEDKTNKSAFAFARRNCVNETRERLKDLDGKLAVVPIVSATRVKATTAAHLALLVIDKSKETAILLDSDAEKGTSKRVYGQAKQELGSRQNQLILAVLYRIMRPSAQENTPPQKRKIFAEMERKNLVNKQKPEDMDCVLRAVTNLALSMKKSGNIARKNALTEMVLNEELLETSEGTRTGLMQALRLIHGSNESEARSIDPPEEKLSIRGKGQKANKRGSEEERVNGPHSHWVGENFSDDGNYFSDSDIEAEREEPEMRGRSQVRADESNPLDITDDDESELELELEGNRHEIDILKREKSKMEKELERAREEAAKKHETVVMLELEKEQAKKEEKAEMEGKKENRS